MLLRFLNKTHDQLGPILIAGRAEEEATISRQHLNERAQLERHQEVAVLERLHITALHLLTEAQVAGLEVAAQEAEVHVNLN